jgi:ssDNA thymidine ADP-ribosyltransferase DarT-like protein
VQANWSAESVGPQTIGGMAIPPRPRIYHITHVDNLADIAADGVIWSDSVTARRGGPAAAIGMSTIKQRRLCELLVKCHPETFVGEYVPFYFCPRSIMLYLIYMANHPELTYRGGQEPIVHLEADLNRSRRVGRCTSASLGFQSLECWRTVRRVPLLARRSRRRRLGRGQ